MAAQYRDELEYALRFTEVYRAEPDLARREAACLALQIPRILAPIAEDDLVVGGIRRVIVGFSPQNLGVYAYFFHDAEAAKALDALDGANDPDLRARVEAMRAFWKTERTEAKTEARFRARFPDGLRVACKSSSCRIAGMNVDLGLLVRLGLDGLKRRNDEYRRRNGPSAFYDALDRAVDLVADAGRHYADEAEGLAPSAAPARRAELLDIAATCRRVASAPPATFKEGLQLVWLYAICADLMNYGRMDEYLGALYAADLDAGRLDEAEALRRLVSLYRQIGRVGKVHDARIVIGGEGRSSPEAADRLALAIIRAAREYIEVVPQVTLRHYQGMDPRLMDETLENILAGAVYPIVYSDGTTVPAIEKIYRCDRAMARHWVPFGCGEYVLEGYGVATPNSVLSPPRALDLVLHGGVNSFTGRREVDFLPDPSTFGTFEELFAAYDGMIRRCVEELAVHEDLNYRVAGENADFLLASLLMRDCVERGEPLLRGGVRYLAATDEIFGGITCADSLTAIKHCVYERRQMTLAELIRALDDDFVGHERLHALLRAAPKYGNDDEVADAMAVRVFNHLADIHEDCGARLTGLFAYKICSVNNSGSADRGAATAASACGRRRGAAYANGHSPSLGADSHGLTATLNSMAKFDAARHVGVVHNIRFNRDLLAERREAIRMTLETFYENNGAQTNLSSVHRGDLEDALRHPGKHRNLIVRIGGFSARFVELEAHVQTEILARTTYGNA